MTVSTPLTGQSLLDYVHNNQHMSRTELCATAGYDRKFTSFYEAILDARKANGEYQEPQQSGPDWYDCLTDQQRELYDMIEERCPEFEKFNVDECDSFMSDLEDIGITTAEQFECAYLYTSGAWSPGKDFAEYFVTDLLCESIPPSLESHIDWQSVWDHELYYEINTIEMDGDTYFFQNV